MITVQDLKEELRIDPNDSSQDDYLQKVIDRVQAFLRGYCNNPDLNFEETPELDEIVLYLCVRAANPDTRYRAGKQAENMGISTTYLNDLPNDYKRVLSRYRRLKFV